MYIVKIQKLSEIEEEKEEGFENNTNVYCMNNFACGYDIR